MAFGQASGPPASHSQLRELTELLEAAGHSDFRDARGPMGFTQRQASGKFTRDEADEFIAALQEAAHESNELDAEPNLQPKPKSEPESTSGSKSRSKSTAVPNEAPVPARPKQRQRAETAPPLDTFTDEQLAAELQSRGWVVMEP